MCSRAVLRTSPVGLIRGRSCICCVAVGFDAAVAIDLTLVVLL